MPEFPALEGTEPGVQGDLDQLLSILRPSERELIFLHYYQGHTAEEISKLVEQPRGTVLSTLHRALAKLRRAAAEPAGDSAEARAEKTPSAGRPWKSRCNQWIVWFVAWF